MFINKLLGHWYTTNQFFVPATNIYIKIRQFQAEVTLTYIQHLFYISGLNQKNINILVRYFFFLNEDTNVKYVL